MQLSDAAASQASARRVWRAGMVVFDEATLELRVDGRRRAIEAKPLALLQMLLSQANMVVTKDALLAAAWDKKFVGESSLTTAINKLRTALGSQAHIVEAVQGVGYRIVVPVEVGLAPAGPQAALLFQPGDAVVRRPQWRLERPLGANPDNDVWLARHAKTGEARVFKFADTAARLDALKREAALSRVLRAALGERDDIVPVLEWNFEERPYFIELPYGGPDLVAWAAQAGGLEAVPLAERVALVAKVAATVAAAHGAGVLHGDIKPANILAEGDDIDSLRVRLVDFGAGGLRDAALAEAVALSLPGLTEAGAPSRTGTWLYLAPEIIAGGAPTVAADVYALGILLYQIVVGDFERPLAAGWEHGVADELLRQDIADAGAGDPARRLASASILAERLRTIGSRRQEAQRREAEAATVARLADKVRQAKARQPWLILAMLSLLVGMAVIAAAGVRVGRERDLAARQARLAQAVNHFLTEDLLGRGDPSRSGMADETLMDAAKKAESQIDIRFGNEPAIAASIYQALANSYAGRTAYDAARAAYAHAVALFERAQGADSPDATISRLRWAETEALSAEPGSLDTARKLIVQASSRVERLGARTPEARVWLAEAQACLELITGNPQASLRDATLAADLGETMPDVFDASSRLRRREDVAFATLRTGHPELAESLLRSLQVQAIHLHGRNHPDTVLVGMMLAETLISRGAFGEAFDELNRICPEAATAFGPDNRQTLMALSTRAQAAIELEHYDTAVEDSLTVYHRAAAKSGMQSFAAFTALNTAAEGQCRSGREQAGLDNARRAYAAALGTFGAKSGYTQASAPTVVLCLVLSGLFADAESQLSAIDLAEASKYVVDPSFPAEVDVLRAAIAEGKGDFAQARVLLREPQLAFEAAGADPYYRRWTRKLLSAATR